MRSLSNMNWSPYVARNVFGNESVTFLGIAGVVRNVCPGLMPSECTAASLLHKVDAARRTFRVVVLNFAGLHLLHMFPHRPWWVEDEHARRSSFRDSAAFNETLGKAATQLCYTADYAGFVRLEDWIRRDVAACRRALPNARIAIATPNWVCNERYYGYYRWLTSSPEGLTESAKSCVEFVHKYRTPSWPHLHSLHAACRSSQQSGNGSAALSARIREVATALNVTLLDWNAMTMNRCDQTCDGRHYSAAIVRAQLEQLRTAVGAPEAPRGREASHVHRTVCRESRDAMRPLRHADGLDNHAHVPRGRRPRTGV